MAAPSFVDAGTGASDVGGAWSYTCQAGTAGDILIIQILQDGTTNNALSFSVIADNRIENLGGTPNSVTQISGPLVNGSWAVGGSEEALQFLFIGRYMTGGLAPTISGGNSTSEDLYIRSYRFTNVSTGTTLATVIEGAHNPGSAGAFDTSLYGGSGTFEKLAESFVAPTTATATQVLASLRKYSSPADNLVVEIQTDSAGLPSGTVVGTGGSIAGSALTTSQATYPITISASLTAGTTYWVVFSRSGARDTANYFGVYRTAAATPGACKYQDSGSWVDQGSVDLWFGVVGAGLVGVDSGTSATVSDVGVTTLGPDRLALNFVAINDDNAMSAFTGETGGDWTEAVAEYADATGTDGAIGLQISYVGPSFGDASGAGLVVYGGTGTNEQQAQSFPSGGGGTVASITLKLERNLSPTDNVIVELQTDAGGVPSGTVVGTGGTISAASLPVSSWVTCPITGASLSASTTYWIVVRRDGSRDTTNFVGVNGLASDSYAGGTPATRDSGTWTAGTGDRGFAVSYTAGGTIDGGTFTQADGTDGWGVVGFALIGTTVADVLVLKHGFVNFQDPGVL